MNFEGQTDSVVKFEALVSQIFNLKIHLKNKDPNICILGDFNTDLERNSNLTEIFNLFVECESLIGADYLFTQKTDFTYKQNRIIKHDKDKTEILRCVTSRKHIINILVPFFILFFLADSQNTTIEHVTVFFRHGNRGPFHIYPTDPNKADYWSRYGGMAELTARGTKQMYDLGQYLKSYYSGVIPKDFDLNKVYVRSTGIKRALISAEAFMAGMYQPNQFQKWNNISGISNWLPIPIQSAPINEDPLFNFNSDFKCQKYQFFKNQSLQSTLHLNITAENEAFVKKIANLSGIQDLDYYKLWIISDTTYNELAEGLNVPQWVLDNFERIIKAKNYGYELDFDSVDKAKFFGGTLLHEINQNIRNKIDNNLNYTISIYSNHDYHLVGLISLLNFTWPLVEIPYASAIVVELRKDSNNNYYTQVLLRNGTYGNPQPMSVVQLNGCEKLCPIDKYLELTANKELSDYLTECEFPTKSNRKSYFEIIIGFLLKFLS
ncbi:unnamed protein product [Brachionus calyciflorus]|uniref:acid phosphatase n=1 Tax=Brachionus calyciflorus TaxID=104777 RepID=A0A813PIT3_9BILA|nr:unnamed protein product [Brachionus calyciflorus]